NLIAFFIHHHQWRWRFDRRLAIASGLDEYTVERTGSPFIVIRDRAHWNLDFKDPSLFRDIAQTMRSAGLTSLAVFCVHQYPGTLTPDQQNSLRRTVYQLAAAENLDVGNLVLDGLNVYARFGRALKTGFHPVSATYGANCGAPAGNATADFQRQCD